MVCSNYIFFNSDILPYKTDNRTQKASKIALIILLWVKILFLQKCWFFFIFKKGWYELILTSFAQKINLPLPPQKTPQKTAFRARWNRNLYWLCSEAFRGFSIGKYRKEIFFLMEIQDVAILTLNEIKNNFL